MRFRSLVAALALTALLPATLCAADTEGDRKIRETIERAEDAEKRAKDREPAEDSDAKDKSDTDTEEHSSLLGVIAQAVFKAFFEVLFENAATLRFAAYPYSPASPYLHNTSTWILPDERKWVSLELSSDAAAHFDGTWGNANRAILQLAGLHLNVYQLGIYSETEGLSVLSANAGITFFVPAFLLSGFVGGYSLDSIDGRVNALRSGWFSFGFDCKAFFPGGVHLDVFNLNAAVGDEVWSHWEGTGEVQLRRLALGVGWRRSDIAGSVFSGPCVRASLWL